MDSSLTAPKTPLFPRGTLLPFILLTTCFAAWGLANNMTDPLVKVFSRIFTMSAFQSSLVQFSFYGAYFCLAIPAALIIKRYTYKTGVLLGLGLFVLGSFLFYPASLSMQFGSFLIAIFVLAGGLSILETSCNPYICALGPESSATRRLNLAQAFNPVGSNIGIVLAATFILPKINPLTDAERRAMDPETLHAVKSEELLAVMGPYLGMAAGLLVLWIAIALVKMPKASDSDSRLDFGPTFARLVRNRHYAFGVVAQFFYVAAQICVWTFTIHYITELIEQDRGASTLRSVLGAFGVEETASMSGENIAGKYHLGAMLTFLVFRFICTGLMWFVRPSAMLAGLAAIATLLCAGVILFPGLVGVLCLIGISACMSLMFPTIYGIALQGLGDDTKLGGAGLVMAILGGAIFPMLQASLVDHYGAALSYLIPLVCFTVVAAYGLFDLRARRKAHWG
jgi:MFS transporter, FHS family, L-fucose permease